MHTRSADEEGVAHGKSVGLHVLRHAGELLTPRR